MTHDYHDALPGYDPEQIWHDGCKECEARGAHLSRGIATLDNERYARAWQRAIDWQTKPLKISNAERELLSVLWAIHCRTPRPLQVHSVGPLVEVLSDYFNERTS